MSIQYQQIETIPPPKHRGTAAEYKKETIDHRIQCDFWPKENLLIGTDLGKFLTMCCVLYLQDPDPLVERRSNRVEGFLQIRFAHLMALLEAMKGWANNVEVFDELTLRGASETKRLHEFCVHCVHNGDENFVTPSRTLEGYYDALYPHYYYINQYFTGLMRGRDSLMALTGSAAARAAAMTGKANELTTKLLGIFMPNVPGMESDYRTNLILKRARMWHTELATRALTGGRNPYTMPKTPRPSLSSISSSANQARIAAGRYLSSMLAARNLTSRSASTPRDAFVNLSTGFGKKKKIRNVHKINSKGIWLNTKYGVRKVKDNAKGLYILNNKSKKNYIHLWS